MMQGVMKLRTIAPQNRFSKVNYPVSRLCQKRAHSLGFPEIFLVSLTFRRGFAPFYEKATIPRKLKCSHGYTFVKQIFSIW